MGAAEQRDDDDELVAVPRDAFERMLQLLERQTRALENIVQTEQRRLAQEEDTARRAARKVGPTTDEAMDRVQNSLRRKGLL